MISFYYRHYYCCLLLLGIILMNNRALAGHPLASDMLDRGYEDYKMRRRRSGQPAYAYEPQWVDEALCGTIDEKQCQEIDEAFGREVKKKMKIMQDVNARRNDLHNRELQDIEPVGSFKVLVLLMRWQDHETVEIAPREDYDRMFNADASDVGSNVIPTGSIRRYFEVSSYDKLTFEATVIDWMTTDNTETFYAGTNTGRSPATLQALVPLLQSLDNDGFDFGSVDSDDDDIIDMVVVLHSGYASEEGGVDLRLGLNTLPENRIQSHSSTATLTSLTWTSREGYQVGQYLFASAFRQTSGANIARLGVPTHEMFHNFGLVDLYDIDGVPNDVTPGNLGGIDRFGLMANPAGQRNNKARCGHLSAWSKERLGFAIPIVITTDGTYSARPVELFPEIYRIDLSPTEYLLIEHRVPIPGDFDERFWGNGGIVIYKIDAARTNPTTGRFPGNTRRGFPGQDGGWPLNGNHYPVAVLQADSIGTPGGLDGYELEKFTSGGEEEDLWLSSTQSLGPGTAEAVATNDIFPNTDLYGDSGIQTTGVTVSNFRIMDGAETRTMLFDVSGLLEDGTASEMPSGSPTESPSTSPSTSPSSSASSTPSNRPSNSPSGGLSNAPSNAPSTSPSIGSSNAPSTGPTAIAASESPTGVASLSPSSNPTPTPSLAVASEAPSQAPTLLRAPGSPSQSPSRADSAMPTPTASLQPTIDGASSESSGPSQSPTVSSADMFSSNPSQQPTPGTDGLSTSPSSSPSQGPTVSIIPTGVFDSTAPSSTPTTSNAPSSGLASSTPTVSLQPTLISNASPSPSKGPTVSAMPTRATDSTAPSSTPATSNAPSGLQSSSPSVSSRPTIVSDASIAPSMSISSNPSTQSAAPTISPSMGMVMVEVPSGAPTTISFNPTIGPISSFPTISNFPTIVELPSARPSRFPSAAPTTEQPSAAPVTIIPSASPTAGPGSPPTRPPALAPLSGGGPEIIREYDSIFPPTSPPSIVITNSPVAVIPASTVTASSRSSSKSGKGGKGGKSPSSSSSSTSRSSRRRLQRSPQVSKFSTNTRV